MKAIGLDIGTTSICGILADIHSGTVEKSITLPNDSGLSSPNVWEKIQSPLRILETVHIILSKLMCDGVVSIGVTGQMHGILYVDAEGNAVSPLYTWQDGRGDLAFQNTTYARFLNSATGYGLVTDFYNEKNGLISETAEKFCTIHDFVVMKLCGNKAPVVHVSDAASFGLYDLKNNAFTIVNDRIPEVVHGVQTVGYYKNIPVTVAIGDNQASFIGSVKDQNAVLVNVGTGSQISVLSDEIYSVRGLETRPLYDDKYILVGSALCGGRSFAALECFFREVVFLATKEKCASLYGPMLDAIDNLKETGLIFDNRFCGTREEPDLKGSIQNISLENFTPENFIFGSLYAISDELFQMYQKTGKTCGTLVGSGNGIRKNKKLRQMFEAAFSCKMNIPNQQEEASFGAMLFSLAGSKLYESIEEAQKIIQYEETR
ncbi:MAG: sedoheptulokinase [Eubacteriales bacterium]